MSHIVSSGQVSSGVSLYYDSMYVSSGGTAINTTISSRGSMYVSSGGSAISTVVSSGGTMLVSSGASAPAIKENGGFVYASDSTNVTFIPNVFSCAISNGGATVHSGTLASSASVASFGSMIVSSGGSASATLVSGWSAKLFVLSGGTVNSTTIVSAGNMTVASSGAATSTTVDYGYLFISGSGMISSTTINSNGCMTIYSGGSASSTVVNSGGCMFVSSGGSASWIRENGGFVSVASNASAHFVNNTFSGSVSSGTATAHSGTTAYCVTIDDYGCMLISSGGMASSTVVSGRYAKFLVYSSGMATSTTILSACSAAVSSGGTMVSTLVDSYGRMTVDGSGAASTTVVSGYSAKLQLFSRGAATSTTVGSGASMIVSSRGSASATTVSSGASMVISGGGTATETTVHSGGSVIVSTGGSALQIKENGGCVAVENGASASFIANAFSRMSLDDHHLATLHSGTTAAETTINDCACMMVFTGGAANRTTLHGGTLYVFAGGSTNLTTVENCSMTVSCGGVAMATTLHSGGAMAVSSGGTASLVNVDSAGNLVVCGGGTAAKIIADQGALLNLTVTAETYAAGTFNDSAFKTINGCLWNYSVRSGCVLALAGNGMAAKTDVASCGTMNVCDGGVAVETVVASAGSALAFLGGTVAGMHVLSGGAMTASYGTSATGIVIDKGAAFTLTAASNTNVAGEVNGSAFNMANGVLSNYTVSSGCTLEVLSGGTVAETTVARHGRMNISGGGVQRGKLSIQTEGDVVANYGAVFDFTLDEAAKTAPLIDRWDYISGGDQASYTVSVTTDPRSGKYLLAGGASDFSCSVSLRDSQQQTFAELSPGQSVSYQGITYQLSKNAGILALEITNTVITITADSASKVYDGTALTAGYSYTPGVLRAGDELFVSVKGSVTDAGSAVNHVESYKVMRGTLDVTQSYSFATEDGTLTVTPRPATLMSNNATKVYDGLALTAPGIFTNGFAPGEGATGTATGSRTEVGTSGNTFVYTLNNNTKASNYHLSLVEGDLTVLPAQRVVIPTDQSFALPAGNYTNSVPLYGNGGAAEVQQGGILTAAGSLNFLGNIVYERDAAYGGFGGALVNYGYVALANAGFFSNVAANAGGAIANYHTIDLNGQLFFSTNQAKLGGAVYNAGVIRVANSITLVTAQDTWVNEGSSVSVGITNWDLRNAPQSNLVCINNFQYFSNVGNKTAQTITVNAYQALGNYTIATGDLSDVAGKESFLLSLDGTSYSTALVADGAAVTYEGRMYLLGIYDTSLIVSVYESQRFVATQLEPAMLISGKTYSNTLPYYGNGGAGEVQVGGVLNAAGDVAFVANAAVKKGDSESGKGGAFINLGTAQLGKATFMYNSADFGGAICNAADFTISGGASFISNASRIAGGAIENYHRMTFLGDATFVQNYSTTVGGAIDNHGNLTLSGNNNFYSNMALGNGGAIANDYVININGNVYFSNNSGALGGAIYNQNLIRLTGAVTLVNSTDTWVNQGSDNVFAITDWDLRTAPQSNAVCINNFQYFRNVGNKTAQTITVKADQAFGHYTIATGDLNDLEGKENFLLTLDHTSYSGALVAGGAAVTYQGRLYQLGIYSTSLILTVSAEPLTMASAPSQGEVWNFDCTGCDSAFEGTSFADDTLNVDTTALMDEWTLLAGADGAITDLASAASVSFGASAATWNGVAWTDGFFSLTTDEAKKTLLVSKLS